MKNLCITFLVLAIIILSFIGLNLQDGMVQKEYLRIHIRADSNVDSDQNVKYKVKDAVVNYLTPFIAECDTKKKAETLLTDRLDQIKVVVDGVLKANGFDYGCNLSVKEEKFPTRVYGELELKAGIYDALIINLGSGKGDNWWCVVYPPLCFIGSEGTDYKNIKYKSKLVEIVQNFFN